MAPTTRRVLPARTEARYEGRSAAGRPSPAVEDPGAAMDPASAGSDLGNPFADSALADGSGFDSGGLDPSTDPAGPWPDVTELPGASVSTTAPVTDSPSASSSATETRAGESTGASQSEPTACPTDPCGGFVSVKFGNGGAHPRHSADGRATAETSATDTTATDTTPTCDTATSSTTSSTSDSAE